MIDQPPPIHITAYAVQRFQERVANVPEDQVRAALDCAAVRLAAKIGAPFVKLAGGQRVALVKNRVVTVLARDHGKSTMCREADARRQGYGA